MNILIFVVSLLTMLTLITYARLDMYRNFSVTQGEFEKHMSSQERDAINKGAKQWYDWTSLSTKSGGKKHTSPKDASPYINLYWLIHPESRTPNPTLAPVYRELLEKVILAAFGKETHFKEALQDNPHLLDDLFQAIETAGNLLTQEKTPITGTDGLENLNLNDHRLQTVYYHLMKGYTPPSPSHENPLSIADGEYEEPSDDAFEEHQLENKKVSLLNFITVNPVKTKIRIFLAPKTVLHSIFDDPYIVDEILQTRISLYQRMQNEEDNKGISEEFKRQFLSRVVHVPETMLDFTVTNTDPRQYEIK